MPRAPTEAALQALKNVVGDGGWLSSAGDMQPFLSDFRRLYRGAAPLVVMPRSTGEVCELMRICHREAIGVVPHGGNTSYCGGATPDESGTQIVLSLQRLNRIRDIDAVNYSMIAEAGVTLAAVQRAARESHRLFPLSIGSEGSAQIGGNLATNAGGTAVLRYGMMRDLVFGIEAVLPDGRLVNGLSSLRKDNTGYDVKSLFIGAEGTLGVITAAALKLFPEPVDSATALVGVADPQSAIALLGLLRNAGGEQLTAFEMMMSDAVAMTVKRIPGVADPLQFKARWYVLIEFTSPNPAAQLTERLSTALEAAAERGMVQDAMLATSLSQAESMWKLRESIPEAQRLHGAMLKHDISVPVSAIPEFIVRGDALVAQIVPDGAVICYGHAGDGNLHFNVSVGEGCDEVAFLAKAAPLEGAIFDLSANLGGSISAEHGIGRLKADEFAARADPTELAVMHAVKRALDPLGIMNPGKVLLRAQIHAT